MLFNNMSSNSNNKNNPKVTKVTKVTVEATTMRIVDLSLLSDLFYTVIVTYTKKSNGSASFYLRINNNPTNIITLGTLSTAGDSSTRKIEIALNQLGDGTIYLTIYNDGSKSSYGPVIDISSIEIVCSETNEIGPHSFLYVQ